MSKLIESLRKAPILADGAMGSYLFERTGRLSEMNHVYEALNVQNPDLIRSVHMAYLQTGARCLTTNTFGANADALETLGEREGLGPINRAAVRIARDAIERFHAQSGGNAACFILGSLGPPLRPVVDPIEIRDIYRRQVEILIDEGVDALLLETFASLKQARAVVSVIREFPQAPPVILHTLTCEASGPGDEHWTVEDTVATAVDLGVPVVGMNCCAPWDAEEFLDRVSDLAAVRNRDVLLSLMPNAGGFRRIGQRYMNHVNAELFGRMARTLAERGVSLIGGCCEVNPPYIAEMRNYLQSVGIGEDASRESVATPVAALEPTSDETKKENGPLSRKMKEGRFAVSVELLPPRGTGARTTQGKIDFVRELAASGLADAVDFTDGSRGIPLMPPGDFIAMIRGQLGFTGSSEDPLEMVPHFTTRDLNAMGLQSRLIGYHARRIHNVLFVTGDPPKMAPTYPRSSAVFDLDSVEMVRYAHSFLNSGLDLGGQPLSRAENPRTRFTIGSGFEPEALNMEREIRRLEQKIDHGADYIFTQPAFRFRALDVLEDYRSKVPILVGVMVLSSLEHARRVGQVPGVLIPETIFEQLAKYEQRADQAKAGQEIAALEVRRLVSEGWAGLYLMAPAGHAPVLDVLRAGLT